MRVDCRHYVRDLALAAALFGVLGLNSAAYPQSLNTLANIKNPKFVLDPSWPKPLPAPVTNGVAHPWVQGEQLRRPEFNRVGPCKIARSTNQKPTCFGRHYDDSTFPAMPGV